jgi:hypothetical protein
MMKSIQLRRTKESKSDIITADGVYIHSMDSKNTYDLFQWGAYLLFDSIYGEYFPELYLIPEVEVLDDF